MLLSSFIYRMKALQTLNHLKRFSSFHIGTLQLELCCSSRFIASGQRCRFGPVDLVNYHNPFSHMREFY